MDLGRKVTNLIIALFAIIFILLGVGILFHIFLPGAQLTEGKRLIFGGLILAYGIFRIIGVIRKMRRQSQFESTSTINEQGRNQ